MKPPGSPSAAVKYGPVVALLAVAALVGYWTLSGTEESTETGESASDSTETSVDASTEEPSAEADPGDVGGTAGGRTAAPSTVIDPGLPITYQQAEAAGTVDQYEWLGNCDTERGRVAIYTHYAAPCVAAPEGAAGGATAPGVTEDTIKIVVYNPSEFDLGAAIDGGTDPKELTDLTMADFMAMWEDTYETWGRKIEWVSFVGTAVDDISARADAQKVANEIGAFASIGGPSLSPAYADELRSNGVLCLVCGLGVPDAVFVDNAPYYWGYGQTPEQFLKHLTGYVGQRLVGRNAIHAGDPAYQSRERSLGVVHFEQDPPVFTELRNTIEEQGRQEGWEVDMVETYQLDFSRMETRSREIITRLKAEEVTSVIFLGDLLMPQFLTKEATAQNYFPEWIISGTVLTDSTFAGRTYDQQQWANAFGISSYGVPVGASGAEGWQLYRWYYGQDPQSTKNIEFIFRNSHFLTLGIHLAGPNLTAETFEAGLFNYPVTGGSPTVPQISFGNTGLFDDVDYQGLDDVVEIWWDPNASGLDEQGNPGTGMVQYANGGLRYAPGEMPSTDASVFDPSSSVTSFEGTPEAEKLPDYPAPAN